MPKLKTKKGLSKRVKVTKNKKVIRSKAGKRHLLSCKSKKRKRGLKKGVEMSTAQKLLIKRGLPYNQ